MIRSEVRNNDNSATHFEFSRDGQMRRRSVPLSIGLSSDAKEGFGFKIGDRIRYRDDLSGWITGRVQGIPIVDGKAQPFARIRGKLYSIRIVEKI